MAHNYRDRRYRVIDGALKKSHVTPPEDGWYVTKAEAWDAWNVAVAATPRTSEATTKSIGYQKRRYKVVDGKLAKKWDSDPSWFTTKADAWAAHAAEAPPEAAAPASAPETPKIAPQINEPRSLIDGGTITVTVVAPEPGDGSSTVPQPPPASEPPLAAAQKVLRVSDVLALTGLSRTTLYRKVKAGKFVPALDLGAGHVGFLETDVSAWQRAQPGASKAPEPEAAT